MFGLILQVMAVQPYSSTGVGPIHQGRELSLVSTGGIHAQIDNCPNRDSVQF